jgi:hypothetical protein
VNVYPRDELARLVDKLGDNRSVRSQTAADAHGLLVDVSRGSSRVGGKPAYPRNESVRRAAMQA